MNLEFNIHPCLVCQAFTIFWSFIKRFWCGLKQKSINNLEHHLFPDRNKMTVWSFRRPWSTTALKYHYSIKKNYQKRPLKDLKMYETPRYWIFLMLESRQLWSWPPPGFFVVLYTCGIKNIHFLVRQLKNGNIFLIWPMCHTPCGHHESYGSLSHYIFVIYQNEHFLYQEAQKTQSFWNWTTLNVPSGQWIVVISMKKMVRSTLWFLIAL